MAVSGALGHHPVTDVCSVDDGGLGDVGDGAVVVGGLFEVGKHAAPGGVVRISFPPVDRFQAATRLGERTPRRYSLRRLMTHAPRVKLPAVSSVFLM